MRAFITAVAFFFGAAGAAAQGFDHEHAAWTTLLTKHVVLLDGGKASQARYAGFQQDRSALKR